MHLGVATSVERHRDLDEAWQHIGAMLNRMIEKQADFCRSAGKPFQVQHIAILYHQSSIPGATS